MIRVINLNEIKCCNECEEVYFFAKKIIKFVLLNFNTNENWATATEWKTMIQICKSPDGKRFLISEFYELCVAGQLFIFIH